MNQSQAKIVVKGKVQGVFFRHSTREKARSVGLAGWVKNLGDGSVEILAVGQRASVEKLVDWCHLGPPNARVEKVDVEWLEPGENEGADPGTADSVSSSGAKAEQLFEIR